MSFTEEIKTGIWSENGGIFVCNCGSEMLSIEFSDDGEFKEGDFCSMSMWYYGHTYYSFFDKIRMCWYIFRHGHPYTDNICFSRKQTKSIKKLLNKKLKEYKNGKSVKKNDKG